MTAISDTLGWLAELVEEASKQMKPKALIAVGVVVAVLTDLWWYSEVAGRLGKVNANAVETCLVKFGTGGCERLWFVGLHQENQIASLIFWGGVAAAAFGFWQYAQERGRTRR